MPDIRSFFGSTQSQKKKEEPKLEKQKTPVKEKPMKKYSDEEKTTPSSVSKKRRVESPKITTPVRESPRKSKAAKQQSPNILQLDSAKKRKAVSILLI